jgi:putative ABC transport system ATP-binding protein
MQLLREVNLTGITVLIVTHEHDISNLTDRIIHIRDGVIGDNIIVEKMNQN